jgi:hypothetical protein
VPRLQRALLSAASGVVLALAGPASAKCQTGYARFDLTTVQDTTFTFSTPRKSWVAAGQHGLAVDPAHGDELIAKFRVTGVQDGTATAVITGQTARLTTGYVALLAQPKPPFYRNEWFWVGIVAGGLIGYAVHTH